MAASAGYSVQLKVGGTPTAMTEEPTVLLGDVTYRIADATKHVLNPGVAITATTSDGLTTYAADEYEVDYLFGLITFTIPDPGDPPLVTGEFIPLLTVAEARSIAINASAAEHDSSVMGEEASKFELGQATAEGTLESLSLASGDLDSEGGGLSAKGYTQERGFLFLQAHIQDEYFRAWVRVPGLQEEAGNADLYRNTLTWKSTTRVAAGRSEVVSFNWGSAT